jgi:hypothetical protein
MIAGSEAYSDDAELPFDNVLDRLTGSDPTITDYVLEVGLMRFFGVRMSTGWEGPMPKGVLALLLQQYRPAV